MTCTLPGAGGTDPGPVQPSSRRTGTSSLAELTTLGVGGPAADVVVAGSEDEIVDAVRDADNNSIPLLVLGGGSNLVGNSFQGRIVIDGREDIADVDVSGCGGALVRATAGTSWDEFVCYTIAQGYTGLEALSGIPGSVGATPVQNVGAYGHDVSETLASVRVYDRLTKKRTDLSLSELALSYRSSALKESMADWGMTPRWVVLSVTFQFLLATDSAPIQYTQLATHLGVEVGAKLPANQVRQAVLDLRRSKGMVLDDADRDTYSAGSFFTNPIIEPHLVPEGAPQYAHGDLVKTSAAWLIDHAGCGKGFGADLTGGRATLSTKHALALTNRGGATTEDIVTLARAVQTRVYEAYGITLVNEPMILGESL